MYCDNIEYNQYSTNAFINYLFYCNIINVVSVLWLLHVNNLENNQVHMFDSSVYDIIIVIVMEILCISNASKKACHMIQYFL